VTWSWIESHDAYKGFLIIISKFEKNRK